MNVLIAPDSFKGSASAQRVALSLEQGILRKFPEAITRKHPMADGGEGTAEILGLHNNAEEIQTISKDPLNKSINAKYFYNSTTSTSFIDMAEASGLHRVQVVERNVLAASTYGTGLLIKDAMERGAKKIVLGLGGSATCDAGIGMAAALGFRFLDNSRNEVLPIPLNFPLIAHVDKSHAQIPEQVDALYDVAVPLLGKNGSAKYMPQKGGNHTQIDFLAVGLTHISDILDPNRSIEALPGSGAAGGLGFGCKAFLNADLYQGIGYVMDQTHIEQHIHWADFLISGEGSFDLQTLDGKVVFGLSMVAKRCKKPFFVVCGKTSATRALKKSLGVIDVLSLIAVAGDEDASIENASALLTQIGEKLATKHFTL